MKQILSITKVAALLTLALAVTVPARAGDLKAASAQAIQNFKLADPGLTRFFENSAGYAVLPSVGEGGLIIGGQRGDGLVYHKGTVIGKVTMTGISIGAQAGGSQFSKSSSLRRTRRSSLSRRPSADERRREGFGRRVGCGCERQV